MNKYEELLHEADSQNISVDEKYSFKGGISGLYVDGNIALSDELETTAEKACVLAEELGHHHTSCGDILDLSVPRNAKQERQARFWAYNRQIGLYGLIEACEAGCQDRHGIAEYLEVTEDFLMECIEDYRDKYGTGVTEGKYYIMFIPSLQIMKLL